MRSIEYQPQLPLRVQRMLQQVRGIGSEDRK